MHQTIFGALETGEGTLAWMVLRWGTSSYAEVMKLLDGSLKKEVSIVLNLSHALKSNILIGGGGVVF